MTNQRKETTWRLKTRQENNIKLKLKETACEMNWNNLVQD